MNKNKGKKLNRKGKKYVEHKVSEESDENLHGFDTIN